MLRRSLRILLALSFLLCTGGCYAYLHISCMQTLNSCNSFECGQIIGNGSIEGLVFGFLEALFGRKDHLLLVLCIAICSLFLPRLTSLRLGHYFFLTFWLFLRQGNLFPVDHYKFPLLLLQLEYLFSLFVASFPPLVSEYAKRCFGL